MPIIDVNYWYFPEFLSVSEWSDRYRRLQRDYAADPGPYDSSKTPYIREIQDSFATAGVRRITIVKASRVGGTEAANNMLGYAIDNAPGPALYVYPTEKDSRDEAKNRLSKFIEGSPQLKTHVPSIGWWTGDELNVDRMTIWMAWAAAPGTLTRRTIRYLFIDELDNCNHQVGALGDTLSLAEKRITTFQARSRTVVVTSPTLDSAAAWTAYNESDQRRYHVPCRNCGVYQLLAFERLKIPEGMRDPERVENDGLAWYQCSACNARLAEDDKPWMLARGVWVPEGVTIVEALPREIPEVVDRASWASGRWRPAVEGHGKATRNIGFHIGGLLSPWRTWSEVMAEFLRAKDHPERLRVFLNQVLGEPWKETVDEVLPERVQLLTTNAYPRLVVPKKAEILIVAADVQKDHLYYIVRAWGPNRESWLIDEGVMSDFDELLMVCLRNYQIQDGETMSAKWAAIDAKYRTPEVYAFASKYHGIYPMTGVQRATVPVRPRPIEYVSNASGRVESISGLVVDTTYYKSMFMRTMRTSARAFEDGLDGIWHLHRQVSEDYCEQIRAEQQVWKTVKRHHVRMRVLVWEPRTQHAKNHFLDCEMMGLALADHKGILSLKEMGEAEAPPVTPEPNGQQDKAGYRIRRYS